MVPKKRKLSCTKAKKTIPYMMEKLPRSGALLRTQKNSHVVSIRTELGT